MTRWEHRLVTVNQPSTGELQEVLDRFGEAGWELVSHTAPSFQHSQRWTFTFKRPIGVPE